MAWKLEGGDRSAAGIWLAGVERAPTPHTSGRMGQGLPDTTVLHYSAAGTTAGTVASLRRPEREVSAHLVVGRDGEVVQLASLDEVTWHAGVSAWKGRTSLNRFAVGIELVNWGRLEESADGFLHRWTGQLHPRADAVQATHRNETAPAWWQPYTAVQIEVAEALCALLRDELGCLEVVGHEEIAPGRKQDPGPAFPLDSLRRLLTGAPQGAEAAPAAVEPAPEPIAPPGAALGRSGLFWRVLRLLGLERVA